MQTVYIELILLDNFLMDFIILFFSVRLSERRVKIWRILLSALLGGIYSITAVLFYSLRSMMLKILVSLILVALARGFKNPRGYFLSIATFYGCSMLLAGAVLLCEYASGGNIADSFVNIPILRYLLLGASLGIITAEIIIRRKQLKTHKRYIVTAKFGNRTIELNAALDTGNSVTDSAGNGVIIADLSSVISQLNCDDVCDIILKSDKKFTCNTVSGSKTMKGILPDELIISDEHRKFLAKGYIALSDNLNYKGCKALLPDNVRLI